MKTKTGKLWKNETERDLYLSGDTVHKSTFIATFQNIYTSPETTGYIERKRFEIELIHPDKAENDLWDDAISCAWIQLRESGLTLSEWELREVLAFTGDDNLLIQHSVRVSSIPRGTFDTWRDLTYAERFKTQ